MKKQVRVLLVEDSEDDAEYIEELILDEVNVKEIRNEIPEKDLPTIENTDFK